MKKIITQIRNIRTNMNIHPSKKSKLIFVIDNDEFEPMIESCKPWIERLGFSNEVAIEKSEANIPARAVSCIADGIKVYMPFEELIDIEEEKKKLETEKQRLEKEVERSTKILSNQGFLNKAPAEKIQEEKEKLEKYKDMLEDTKARIAQL